MCLIQATDYKVGRESIVLKENIPTDIMVGRGKLVSKENITT